MIMGERVFVNLARIVCFTHVTQLDSIGGTSCFLTKIAGSEKINTQTNEFDLDVVWAILHFIIYPYELRFLSLRITQRCFPNHQRWKATQQR